ALTSLMSCLIVTLDALLEMSVWSVSRLIWNTSRAAVTICASAGPSGVPAATGFSEPNRPCASSKGPAGKDPGPGVAPVAAVAGQARGAVQVEHVDEAVALAGHVVLLGGVLLGVGDVDLGCPLPGQCLDVERGVPLGQLRVGEGALGQIGGGLEVRAPHVDGAG